MKTLFKNRIFLSLVFSVFCFTLAFFISKIAKEGPENNQKILEHAETVLHQNEEQIQQFLGSMHPFMLTKNFSSVLTDELEKLRPESEHHGFYFLYFENNKLVSWSDNRVAFADLSNQKFTQGKAIKFKNGWFEPSILRENGRTIIALFLLKNEYSYQNKYLSNVFNPELGFPAGTEFSNRLTPGSVPLKSGMGKIVGHITFPAKGTTRPFLSGISFLLYALSLLMMFVFIRTLGKHLFEKKYSTVFLLLFITGLFLLRFLSAYYEFPELLYKLEIFNPKYFASSSWLSSLGDLMLNSILVFYLVSYFYKRASTEKLIHFFEHHLRLLPVCFSIASGALLILSASLLELIHSLVVNSSISFNVTDIFSLNSYSLYSFIVIGLLFFSLFLLTDSTVGVFKHFKTSPFIFLISFIPSAILLSAYLSVSQNDAGVTLDWWSSFLFSITIFLTIYLLRFTLNKRYGFSRAMLLVFVFTFISTMKISIYNVEKERSSRILLAEKLSREEDFVAEHLFDEIEKKVAADSLLAQIFDSSGDGEKVNMESGIRRLHQSYFNGYWSKYDTKLHAYDKNGNRIFNSNNENVSLDYFEKEINLLGRPTFSHNFFFINNVAGRTSYLAKLLISSGQDSSKQFLGTILVEMDSKLRAEENGFPDLFLSDNVPISREFIGSDYSFARYKNQKLIFQSGDFPYYLTSFAFTYSDRTYPDSTLNNHFVSKEGYDHLLYKNSPESMVVVSRIKNELSDYLTLFSYLFAFFTLLLLLLAIAGQLPVQIRNSTFSGSSFSGRIQLSMIIIVFVSLMVTGSGTAFYIINKYNSQQYERIRQRINSLLIATQNLLGSRNSLDTETLRNMAYDLMTLSLSSSADFNIYDLSGNLLFSTQPKIFEQEVMAEKMNAKALLQLFAYGKSSLTQDENIGNLKFISAYESIRNPDNKLIGYLGLPYFTNQTELKKEISSFLVALINIYVLLFALALILSYVVTERITQPLRAIRQGLGKINLGKRNEPISWDSKDEIGDLILEYNRMVQELSQSAELLAKSERESAWREMAKQVAHEIKNPLTPMKLSVQHLQKAWNDRSPEMNDIVKKISKTLITQIDTLSAIASEFSNFAQMPKAKIEVLDLHEILLHILQLYQENKQIEITFKSDSENKMKYAEVDRDQLLRVFTNLMNNAVEAIPFGQRGILEVAVSTENGEHLISVSDNGTGISMDLQGKIFEPNFTTKNSGMGLGLAMVKNLIEQFNGRIWFKTTEGKGTTFFVALPEYQNRVLL